MLLEGERSSAVLPTVRMFSIFGGKETNEITDRKDDQAPRPLPPPSPSVPFAKYLQIRPGPR